MPTRLTTPSQTVDGHARSQGLGCVVTTFLVGALSAINATAASFAEEVPVLSVVGEPGGRRQIGWLGVCGSRAGWTETGMWVARNEGVRAR